MPDLGDIAAVLALILSAWSMKKTNDFNRRQKEFIENNDRLNQMLIEKEAQESEAQKRADLSANFIKVGKSDYRLKVFNRGPGTATNVRVELVDQAARDMLIESDVNRKFPVPILEQHQNVDLIAGVHLGSPGRIEIALVWDDASGKDRRKPQTPVL
jgi:hypothetical protein